jgi:hypothetical protein
MIPIALAWGGFAARKTHLAKKTVRAICPQSVRHQDGSYNAF